jgi:hypothetical protein
MTNPPIPERKGAADLRRNVARPGIATPAHQPPASACPSLLRNIWACFYTAAPSDSAYASATARRDPIPARTQPTFATWNRPAAVLTPLFRHYAGMACHSPASARPPSGVPSDAERRRATLISIAPGRQQATARVI